MILLFRDWWPALASPDLPPNSTISTNSRAHLADLARRLSPYRDPIVSLYLSSSVAVPMPFDFTATYKSTRQLPSNTQTTRWERWRPGRQVTVHAAVHAARYQLGVQQEPVRLAMYHKKFQVAPGFSCDAHANSLGRLALKFSLFARRQYVLAERDLHRCATFFSRR